VRGTEHHLKAPACAGHRSRPIAIVFAAAAVDDEATNIIHVLFIITVRRNVSIGLIGDHFNSARYSLHYLNYRLLIDHIL